MHILLIKDNENDACLIEEAWTEQIAADIQLERVVRPESGLTRLDANGIDGQRHPRARGANSFSHWCCLRRNFAVWSPVMCGRSQAH